MLIPVFFVQRRLSDFSRFRPVGLYRQTGIALYHYWNGTSAIEGCLFAKSRPEAKRKIKALYPDCQFYK
jgi:hypothetical protein